MKLKSTMFDTMPLPFSLCYGQIGVIDLTVPIWNMFESPLIIRIQDVFAIIKPKPASEWNEQLEQKDFKESTQNQLDQFEIYQQNFEALAPKDPSAVDNLIKKVIDNVQIKIENIYLRYEDDTTARHMGSGKFAVGILLRELSIFTTDQSWTPSEQKKDSEILYKIGRIQDFSIFLDYEDTFSKRKQNLRELELLNLQLLRQDKKNLLFKELLALEFQTPEKQMQIVSKNSFDEESSHFYIIDKFSLQANLMINKSPIGNQLPQAEITLLIGGIRTTGENDLEAKVRFGLKQTQISRLLKLAGYIGHYNQFQKGALAKYNNNTVTKDMANQYVDLYTQWKHLSESKKTAKEASEKRDLLRQMEEPFPYSKIVILRKFGVKILTKQESKKQSEAEYEKKISLIKDQKKSGWFTSKEQKAKNEQDILDFEKRLKEEMKLRDDTYEHEFQNEINAFNADLEQQSTVKEDDFYKMPANYIRYRFKVEIPSVQFEFYNEYNQKIFRSEIQGNSTTVEIGINYQKVSFELGALTLEDSWTGAKAYPNIIETKYMDMQASDISSKRALYVVFESGKNISVAPFKLFLETEKTLFILVNPYFAKELTRTLQVVVKQFKAEDFSFYTDAASEKAAGFMQQGKQFMEALEKGQYRHKSVEIQVIMRAPIILIPEHIFDVEKPCFVVDAGTIKVNSSLLQPYDQNKDYLEIDDPQKLFDAYVIQLESLSIYLLKGGVLSGTSSYCQFFSSLSLPSQASQSSLASPPKASILPIIPDFSARLTIFTCLAPLHTKFPTIEVVLDVEQVDVQAGLPILEGIMKIINTVMDYWESKEQDLIDKYALVEEREEDEEQKRFLMEISEKSIQEIKTHESESASSDGQFFESLAVKIEVEEMDSVSIDESFALEGATNLKVYVAIKRFQVTLIEEASHNQEVDFLNVQMLHFNLVFEVDKDQTPVIQCGIYQFIIQDTQRDVKLAPQFRVSPFLNNIQQRFLSGPDTEGQLIKSKQEQMKASSESNQFDLESINDDVYAELSQPSEGKIIASSLVYSLKLEQFPIPERKNHLLQYDNQFDIKVITQQDEISIDCVISNMRLIFAMPTIRQVVKIYLSLDDMFQRLEDQRYDYRLAYLLKYETVVAGLGETKIEDLDEELILLHKILEVKQVESGKHISVYKDYQLNSLRKIINLIYSAEDSSLMVEPKSQISLQVDSKPEEKKRSPQSSGSPQLKKELGSEKLIFSVSLNSCSMWIPQDCALEQTQIMSLDFQSGFFYSLLKNTERIFENELLKIIKTNVLDQKEATGLTITTLKVQTLSYKSRNEKESSSLARLGGFDKENYTCTDMIEASQILLNNETFIKFKNGAQDECNVVTIVIEPLNMKVGFVQIDFANLMLIHVKQNISNQYNEHKNRMNKVFTQQTQLFREHSQQSQKDLRQMIESQRRTTRLTVQADRAKSIFKEKNEAKSTIKNEITFSFDQFSLQLVDDQDLNDQPLIVFKLVEKQKILLKSVLNQDDAGTYYLKKMGIYKEKNEMFLNCTSALTLSIDYYNQRTLSFEPLVEPWLVIMKMEQEFPYSHKVTYVESDSMFNLNLSYGMALTLRIIMDRVNQIYKQGELLEKVMSEKNLSVLEKEQLNLIEKQKQFQEKKTTLKGVKSLSEKECGYIFQNSTGIPLKFTTHDSLLNKELQLEVDPRMKGAGGQEPTVITLNEKYMKEEQQIQFFSQHVMDKLRTEVTMKNNKGHTFVGIEEEPYKIDIKLNNLDKIAGIPIESLGTYSYSTFFRTQIVSKPVQALQQPPPEQKKDKGGLLGFGLIKKENFKNVFKKEEVKQEEQKPVTKDLVLPVGVLVSIQMEGLNRKINIESQLRFVNNFDIPITIYALTEENRLKDARILIQPGSSFAIPLSWFVHVGFLSIYMEGIAKSQVLLFKHFALMFASHSNLAKVDQSHSQIVQVQQNSFVSCDIVGYKCFPLNSMFRPLQYIVSFNPPLTLINNNFCNLELMNLNSQEVIAHLPPKHNASLTCFDVNRCAYTLQWALSERDCAPMQLVTQNRLFGQHLTRTETLQFSILFKGGKFASQQSTTHCEFQTQKHLNQNFLLFENLTENFEQREKAVVFVSSLSLTLYPRCYLVNKLPQTVIIVYPFNKSLTVDIPPMSSQNLHYTDLQSKLKLKIQGYKESKLIDISTLGATGNIEFEVEKSNTNQLQEDGKYIPQKVEFGIQITAGEGQFEKTTLISLAPRYLLINQLDKPIVVRQKDCKHQLIIGEEKTAYSFEQTINNLIMIREASPEEVSGKPVPNKVNEEQSWSTPFSIEDIENFQVQFPGEADPKNEFPNWHEPNERNTNLRFVRVVVTSQDDATILVVFCHPIQPEIEISNQSGLPIQYAQISGFKVSEKKINKMIKKKQLKEQDIILVHEGSGSSSLRTLQVNETVPYAIQNRIILKKRLLIKTEDSFEVVNLDQIQKVKMVETGSQHKYQLEIKLSGYGKKVIISDISDQQDQKVGHVKAQYLQTLMKRRFGSQLQSTFKFKGIGISVVDYQPREILLFTLFQIEWGVSRWIERRGEDLQGTLEYLTQFKFSFQHMQLDNTLKISLPVIMAPKKVLHQKLLTYNQAFQQQLEEEKKEETKSEVAALVEITPFVQLNFCFAKGMNDRDAENVTERLRSFQISIQEFIITLETPIIMNIMNYIQQLGQVLTDENQDHLFKAKHYTVEKSQLTSRYDFCPLLNPKNIGVIDESQASKIIPKDKMFVEYIHLYSVKFKVSFKLDKDSVDIEGDSFQKKGKGGMNIFKGLMNSALSVTDSPLQFKEVIILDTFTSSDQLVYLIMKNYQKQGIRQIHKLLGASDMIGNPIGFIDKIGAGVFELYSEPKQGLMGGPEEFAKGLGRGVRGYVSNVVSGGFDSISKLSGSLYSVVKSGSGSKDTQLKKADGVFDGVYQGFKGGAQDLLGGVTGVFTKPIERGKQDGAKGALVGAAQGVFGLVSAPVIATLRLGQSVTSGVSTTANNIANMGKDVFINSLYARFRPPRYINAKGQLEPYNEELALVYLILSDVKQGQYSNGSIKFFCDVPQTKNTGELVNKHYENNSLIIVTDEHFLCLTIEKEGKNKGKTTILFKTRLIKILNCYLYSGQESVRQSMVDVQKKKESQISKLRVIKRMQRRAEEKRAMSVVKSLQEVDKDYFILELYCQSMRLREVNRIHKFLTLESSKFEKVFDIVSMSPKCEAVDEIRDIIVEDPFAEDDMRSTTYSK